MFATPRTRKCNIVNSFKCWKLTNPRPTPGWCQEQLPTAVAGGQAIAGQGLLVGDDVRRGDLLAGGQPAQPLSDQLPDAAQPEA